MICFVNVQVESNHSFNSSLPLIVIYVNPKIPVTNGNAGFEKIKADISLDQGLTTDGAAGAEGKAKASSKLEDKAAKSESKAGSELKIEKEAPKKTAEAAD